MNFGILELCRLVCERENLYFIGTFGICCVTMSPHDVFLRMQVDLRRREIFGQKRLKTPEKAPKIAHFCSALPCIVVCVAAQCRHAYSCNKIWQSPNSIISLQIAVFCVLWLGWRTWSHSFFNRHTGLSWGLTRGYLRQKRRRLYQPSVGTRSVLNCDYHLATAPMDVFISVGISAFTTPIL